MSVIQYMHSSITHLLPLHAVDILRPGVIFAASVIGNMVLEKTSNIMTPKLNTSTFSLYLIR